jgi:hypothetical protein
MRRSHVVEVEFARHKRLGAARARDENFAGSSAAIVQSNGEDAANRMQEAGLLWNELAQDAMRQNVEAAQNLMRCRTFGELMEVQSDWMRRSLDNFLVRGARLSELSAQLTLDAMTRFGGERIGR